jgi:pyruvate dehydrogenase E1 component
VHAAYASAVELKEAPVVILAKTVKGWALGGGIEGRNVTHQAKKLSEEELKKFRDRLDLPIADKEIAEGTAPYYHPGPDSEEIEYLLERRRQLGGFLPERKYEKKSLSLPKRELYDEFKKGAKQNVATTMAMVRVIRQLMRDKNIGERVVPIIPDEARTFGMESLFPEFKIYAARGQLYEPVDAEHLLAYRESQQGQILEEGITEAGSMGSFTAAGTSYATHSEPMIPFFIFYSMFGFQRIGDFIWSLADQRGRGFLLGATAGRTTLKGEGLQHADGHSLLLAGAFPTCISYDPTYAYELAVIVKDGLRRMFDKNEDIFYYLTLYNEAYPQPAMPRGVKEEEIVKGLYLLKEGGNDTKNRVQLLGSGSILREVMRAQELLAEHHEVAADVWSAPSFNQLRVEAQLIERWNRLHPEEPAKQPYVTSRLEDRDGPVIAASDWVKAVPGQIARWVPAAYRVLGTDGFGRSDAREAMRRFFEVDAEHIAVAALSALAEAGDVKPEAVTEAIKRYDIDPDRVAPERANP